MDAAVQSKSSATVLFFFRCPSYSQLTTWLLKGVKRKLKTTASSIYSIEIYSSPFFVLKLQAKSPPWDLTFEEWKLFEWTTFQTPHTTSFIFSSSPQTFTDCCPAKEPGSPPLSAFGCYGTSIICNSSQEKYLRRQSCASHCPGRTRGALRKARAESEARVSCDEHSAAFPRAYTRDSTNPNATGKRVSWEVLPMTAFDGPQTEILHLKRRTSDGKWSQFHYRTEIHFYLVGFKKQIITSFWSFTNKLQLWM